tara:strand:+ start:152 stop:1024 length:873 start_codon:yes stop_codon:yes gene_type:complete
MRGYEMAGLSVTGQMKVSTLQDGFFKEFGLTLRIYDGRSFADPTQTLAQVRKKKGSGKALSVAKNMKVGNLEDKFEEEFGLKVQVAGSDDSYLCDNDLTLNAAQQEDQKKLGRKAKKAARGDDESDDDGESEDNADANATEGSAKNYFINYDKSRDACSIIWESEDHAISDLEPYIYAIQCDDGEDFHELINAEWPDADGKDDFRTLEINNFAAVEGDDDNEYLLCFTALVSINLDNHPNFQKALKQSDNQIVARIQFKKDGNPMLDEEGYEEFLFEMHQDNFVELELDN